MATKKVGEGVKGEVDERSSEDEGVRGRRSTFFVITAILRMWLVLREGGGGGRGRNIRVAVRSDLLPSSLK